MTTSSKQRCIGLGKLQVASGQGRPAHLHETEVLDLHDAGINAVVWALGYGYDFGWIGCDVLDARGVPLQQRGMRIDASLMKAR
jgi:hypothetical protein